MMRAPTGFHRGNVGENMMTSMIDVVFLLLIFFVCAAAGKSAESLLPTHLSGGGVGAAVARPDDAPKPDELWIRLTESEQGSVLMTLNGTTYSQFAELQRVVTALSDVAPETPVVLDIAGTVPTGDMVRVYDTIRAARLTNISFNARPDAK
jgi:biopolymer transport protein ExbD